jgi:lipopolysaccharide transport system permease protein
MFADLFVARHLAWRLAARDFKARYRRSFFGYFWAVVPPLIASGTFIFLRDQKVFSVDDTELPYAAFVLVGTVLWQTFADAVNAPLRTVAGNRAILIKLNFPREALILAGIFETLINAAIRLVIVIGVMLYYRIPLQAHQALFPAGFAALILLGICIGLILTPIGVLYQDVEKGLGLVLTFWMFLTPVLYPAGGGEDQACWMQLNPVAPVLDTARAWLTGTTAGHVPAMLTVTACALALLSLGWVLYRLALPHLIVRLGM